MCQAQQRNGRSAGLLPVAAAMALVGAAGAAGLDNDAKCDCDCGYKDEPEEKTCCAHKDKQPVDPLASTQATLKEVVAKLNRIESAVANPHRHTDGLNAGVDVVLGAQWGDEGKGKLVDSLSQSYDVILRVAGGSNAGHTIVHEGKKYKFRLVPSGILNPNAVCIIGNGVVVHLPSLLQELDELKQVGIKYEGRILISDRAHMVLDLHQEVDGINELRRGRNKIGTTKKGIGPAYSSKMLRNGVRVGDLRYFDDFSEKMRDLVKFYKDNYPELEADAEAEIKAYSAIKDKILGMTVDTVAYMNNAYVAGKKILVEGANATMLDIDFGTYPYVTSSNPSIGSVCTGGGISPNRLNGIIGIVKAYCTRVGEGPFPTELHDEVGKHLGTVGAEFGTNTGRPRRCGWLDIPQMRYSNMVNGFTELNLTKLDVLTGLEKVKIGVAYWYRGQKLDGMPSNLQLLEESVVQYEEMDRLVRGHLKVQDVRGAARGRTEVRAARGGAPGHAQSSGSAWVRTAST
ncbi:hypothetical protein ON010_g6114 [Phytophthora cinnamomi]|nr:hypothetical protein ON010_g6114 [Phytophthora cinnamomi]